MRQKHIYALVNGSGEVFYVGASCDVDRRIREHGAKCSFIILETCGTNWRARERYWIAYYRAYGAQLTNRGKGGEGISNHTEVSKSRLSFAFRGRKVTWGDKIAEAQRGKPKSVSPDGRQKVIDALNRGRRNRDAERQAEAMRARMHSVDKAAWAAQTAKNSSAAWASYTAEERAERGRKISAGKLAARLGVPVAEIAV